MLQVDDAHHRDAFRFLAQKIADDFERVKLRWRPGCVMLASFRQ